MAMPIHSADGNPGITALLGEIKALTFPKSLDGLSGEIIKKKYFTLKVGKVQFRKVEAFSTISGCL